VHPSGRRGNTFQIPFNVRQVIGFLSHTQLWKNGYNNPDNVVFPSRCSPSSGKSCIQSSTVQTSFFMVRTLKLHMEIACINSTIRKTAFMIRTLEALIWKLRPAKCNRSDSRATPPGRDSIQERISCEFGNSVAQLYIRTPYVYRPGDA